MITIILENMMKFSDVEEKVLIIQTQNTMFEVAF
jgi:hypothetical protein